LPFKVKELENLPQCANVHGQDKAYSAREMSKFGQHFPGQEKVLSGPLSSILDRLFSFALNLWYARTISDFEERHIFIHPE
jgi:hypothetical protein